jgi:hypothetical protein
MDTNLHLGSPIGEAALLPSIRFGLLTIRSSFKKRRNSTSLPSCWSRTHKSKGLSQEPGARQSPEVQETAVVPVVEAGVTDRVGCVCSYVAIVREGLHLRIVLETRRKVSSELHALCKKFWFQQHIQAVEQYPHRKTWRRCHHRLPWGTRASAALSMVASPTSLTSSSW